MKKQNLKFIFLIIGIVAVLTLSACTTKYFVAAPDNKTTHTTADRTGDAVSGELKKFTSSLEIKEFLLQNSVNQGYSGMYGGGILFKGMAFDSATTSTAAPRASMAMAEDSSAGNGASDYSQTNVQVKGVDEADFVKNDDKYIYVLSQDKLIIVDAYPAKHSEVLSKTEVEGNPREMFVNGDRLVVFTNNNEETFHIMEYDFMPRPYYDERTHALIYDISDRKDPELISDYEIDGSYFNARMIGDYVYFISSRYTGYYDFIEPPILRESSKKVMMPEVFYFDNPEGSYTFYTIAAFDILSEEDINAKTFMLGQSNNLYVSENNIYITSQKNLPWRYYQDHNEERFYDVIVPLLADDVQDEIESIKDDDSLSSYERWSKISVILEDMYNSMDEDDQQDLEDEMSEAVEEYELKLEIERRKTIIHRISIDEGSIDHQAKGEVNGYLLNQFSMDEDRDGYFRVATTTYVYRGDSTMYNNVYVLDDDMEVVGSLEDIAPDERIYSTRFIGDRLYMVTFKNIDPLFVIDLSDPEEPAILGELKIPGFSNYIHPYDEDHIIGIGKETEANQWGGVTTGGVKIALFDVSDVENPEQVDTYEIGRSGTDSEALNDHKAFLFDREKNILVIPVRVVKNRYMDDRLGYYRSKVWQGAYVFGVTPEDGFELKGKVTHNEGETRDEYYYYSSTAVRRALYMDDVLYTVSAKKLVMNDLEDISDEINSLNLPYDDDKQYWWWY